MEFRPSCSLDLFWRFSPVGFSTTNYWHHSNRRKLGGEIDCFWRRVRRACGIIPRGEVSRSWKSQIGKPHAPSFSDLENWTHIRQNCVAEMFLHGQSGREMAIQYQLALPERKTGRMIHRKLHALFSSLSQGQSARSQCFFFLSRRKTSKSRSIGRIPLINFPPDGSCAVIIGWVTRRFRVVFFQDVELLVTTSYFAKSESFPLTIE